MAYIGMRHPVFAPVESYEPGSISYGEGVVLGKAIGATLTLQRTDTSLYADDMKAEADNSVTGGTVSLELDDIKHEDAMKALGLIKRTVNGKEVYSTSGQAAPYGGCGWIRERKINGVISYVVQWVHRLQLGQNTKNAATKGQTITYQTTTLDGEVLGAQVDESMETFYVDEIPMETIAEAITWLDTMANVPKTQSQQVEGA